MEYWGTGTENKLGGGHELAPLYETQKTQTDNAAAHSVL